MKVTDRNEVVGYSVEALDGSIGKINEATQRAEDDHVVIDTGLPVFGKKRLISTAVIDRIDEASHTVFVNMTKREVRDAPEANGKREANSKRESKQRHAGASGDSPAGEL